MQQRKLPDSYAKYRYVEENKGKENVTPEVMDVLKNIPDRQYNNETDLVYGIEQGRG